MVASQCERAPYGARVRESESPGIRAEPGPPRRVRLARSNKRAGRLESGAGSLRRCVNGYRFRVVALLCVRKEGAQALLSPLGTVRAGVPA
jgi:hypothetical protein